MRPLTVIALAATTAPDPRDRVCGHLLLAADRAAARVPSWWAWTSWLAVGITIARIERATRPT